MPSANPATGQPTICSGAPSAVTSLSRQIVYLRPSQFVVYDRSGICDASLDQYLAFHFPANPVEVTAPAPGLHRFDVNTGQFAGSMTTILPANAATVTTRPALARYRERGTRCGGPRFAQRMRPRPRAAG